VVAVIAVHIKPRADGRYEIKVHDRSIAGELLVFSNQGYENEADAERIVRRLFGSHPPAADPDGTTIPAVKPDVEHVDLTVTYLDGTGRHEMIR
jgi:hypothetical protein